MRSSARRSTWRGSPSYGVPSGVRMSQIMRATPCSLGAPRQDANVVGSGIATMSDSSTGLKPVMRGAVERDAVLERLVELLAADAERLQLAEDVGEPEAG